MDERTRVGAAVLAGLAGVGLGMAILFGGGPPPAPPRPRLTPPPVPVERTARYSLTNYQAQLDQDARVFGLPPVSASALRAPFPFFAEVPSTRRLVPGGTAKTAHLALALEVTQETGTLDGQTFRAAHLVLRLQNLTDHYLAYRVETEVGDPKHCAGKGELPYDAVVLAPRERLRRTECLMQKPARLYLKSIEVMELPPLAGMYAARINPAWAFYDARAGGGHVPPRGAACPPLFDWREVHEAARRGDLGWADVVDFYGRHNCDEYSFFPAYRRRQRADEPLPAVPPELASAVDGPPPPPDAPRAP